MTNSVIQEEMEIFSFPIINKQLIQWIASRVENASPAMPLSQESKQLLFFIVRAVNILHWLAFEHWVSS